MNELATKKCVPCAEGTKALSSNEANELWRQLGHGWKVVDNHHLEKEFTFDDFKQALSFTNKIGAIAEEVGHHPDIYLTWGKVRLEIFTHKVKGLTESDFIVAAKFEDAAAR
jgi:4a-hydroxytetrahydrobiopterin dehydratase